MFIPKCFFAADVKCFSLMRTGSRGCVQITFVHVCVCVHTPTLTHGFIMKEWWCFKPVGGLHNKSKARCGIITAHTLPLTGPKVADTGLTAFLTHTHTHTHADPLPRNKHKENTCRYNYYIRGINYMKLRGSGKWKKKRIVWGSFFLRLFPLLLNLSSQFSCTTLLP